MPYILAQFPEPSSRPAVIGSRNVFQLLQGYSQDSGHPWVRAIGGLHNTRTQIIEFTAHHKNCLNLSSRAPCTAGSFGAFRITAFGSDHPSYDYLPGVAIDGVVSGTAPYRAAEYKTWSNTSIGILIEYAGLRLLKLLYYYSLERLIPIK